MEGDWVTVDGNRISLFVTREEDLAAETELYRCFDRKYRLLYVGISLSALARLLAHRNGSWFHKVAHIDIERLPTRRAAEEAERRAIQQERPMFNSHHNGKG